MRLLKPLSPIGPLISKFIQSNLVTMPPVGTEQEWHSSESGIVTRVCKNGLIFSSYILISPNLSRIVGWRIFFWRITCISFQFIAFSLTRSPLTGRFCPLACVNHMSTSSSSFGSCDYVNFMRFDGTPASIASCFRVFHDSCHLTVTQ